MKKHLEPSKEKKLGRANQSLEDHFLLSSRDVFSYFQYIPPEEYTAFGIEEDDVPFGTFAALKHPTLLQSHLGGNAYGAGLFEHRVLNDEELRFLESIDLSDPESLKKHSPAINELYRKMGLLVRLSRKGIFYYLIPFSFIAHYILDIRIRVKLIQSIIPEIIEKKDLKIGVMTSSDDILTHELIARFPQHRFLILSSLDDFSTRRKPFDVFICPHHPAEYLINLSSSGWIPIIASKKKMIQYIGHLFLRLRRNLNPTGTFALVCPMVISKRACSQSKMRIILEKFFDAETWNEILPDEYQGNSDFQITLFPFLCVRAHPKRSKILRQDIEEFLQKSHLVGCPITLVADYKNTLDYVTNVLSCLARLSQSTGIKTVEKMPQIRHLTSRYKKLTKVQAIIDPSQTKRKSVKFFDYIPELSLFGFSRSELQEMGLIVTGHSSLGRVAMGKYPVYTLEPLRKLVKQQPSYIHYLYTMTLAELVTSLKRDLVEAEKKRLDQITKALLDDDKFRELLIPLQASNSVEKLIKVSYERIHKLTMTEIAENGDKSIITPELEKHLIKTFCVDQNFLETFLRAKLHGTGHILPLLGFYPSLVLLWACVFFGKHIVQKFKSEPDKKPDLVINLNPIFRNTPPEHKRDLAEKLKKHLCLAVTELSTPPFHELLYSEKAWFWLESKLHFVIDSDLKIVSVSYFDLEESEKILESFSKHLEAKKARTIPSTIIEEANHHAQRIMQYIKTTAYRHECKVDNTSIMPNLVLLGLWKSLFEKLLSPEEAYETLVIIGKKAPSLLSMLILSANEENFDAIAKAFIRLRSITERHRLSFQETSLFYAMAKREFGPYAEEKIGISQSQFQKMEEMLSSAHADFFIYQATIIAMLVHHLPHQNISEQVDYLLGNISKAKMILDHQEKTVKNYTFTLLKAREIIKDIQNGRAALICLDELTSFHNSRSFLDAIFLLSIVLEKGIMTGDLLAQTLRLRQEVLKALESRKPWRNHLEDIIISHGASFRAFPPIFGFSLEDDVLAYGCFLKSNKEQHELSLDLIRGRYVAAIDRILRFCDLSPVQFNDVVEISKSTPIIELYHRKALSSMGLGTFQELVTRAQKICEKIFSLTQKHRFNLLLSFDELIKESLQEENNSLQFLHF
ncbi:MAG: hypothetical protein WHS38_10600 [Thermodesulforhabdaceae bacterium]